MKDRELQQLLSEAFRGEGAELATRLAACVLAFDGADGRRTAELLATVQRDLHTLKGGASAVSRRDLAGFAHLLEDHARELQSRGRPLLPEEVDLLQLAVQQVSAAVAGAEAPATTDPLLARLHGGVRRASMPPEEVPAELSLAEVEVPPRRRRRSDRVTPEAAQAPLPPVNPGTVGDDENKSVQLQVEVQKAPVLDGNVGAVADGSIRVQLARLAALEAASGDLMIASLREAELFRKLIEVRDFSSDAQRRFRRLRVELRREGLGTREGQGIRQGRREGRSRSVHMERLGAALSELGRSVYQLTAAQMAHATDLGILTEQLAVGLQGVRMMPLGAFLQSFGLAIREAARALQKDVRLVVDDGGIDVDRAVLERLKEPLLHLVRNAVAHGIEVPAERGGKGAQGRIELVARRDGSQAVVEVRDDGAGIDALEVRRRGVDRGWVESEGTWDDEALLQLLCTPGFSTNDSAGEVAGRGIGMDVVLRSIVALGGSLAVQSERGNGTTFLLRFPVSMTVERGLTLRVGPYELGVPLYGVERVLRVAAAGVTELCGQAVVSVGGQPVALADGLAVLGEASAGRQSTSGPYHVVLLRHGAQRLALRVDEVGEEIPMSIRPLGPQFGRLRHLAGGAIRADGSVLPVLDVEALLREPLAGAPAPAWGEAAAVDDGKVVGRKERGMVLVVDDSLTIRTLERSILESAGYAVLTACDGQEALEVLGTRTDVELLVTDVDMPRLNGFDLCRRVRDQVRPELPILVVTSRGSDEERRLGLAAGADAYIVKGNFEQGHFLGAVARLVGNG